jgi:hypothetical protein
MPYRRTPKYTAERQRAMQAGRQRARDSAPLDDRPLDLPDVRMRITVERLDTAQPQRHVFELHTTRRVDVYRVTVDGQPWRSTGLTGVLEGLRKACPRRMSLSRIA